MKNLFNEWIENIKEYGFNSFYSDFENEAEFNKEMTANVAWSDKHITK